MSNAAIASEIFLGTVMAITMYTKSINISKMFKIIDNLAKIKAKQNIEKIKLGMSYLFRNAFVPIGTYFCLKFYYPSFILETFAISLSMLAAWEIYLISNFNKK